MSSWNDPRLLRSFLTVAREGNVTRAAAALHLTQPAVSLQLKRLAEDLGVQLFQRNASGMTLTPQGALLAAKAEQVLASFVDLRQTARQLQHQVTGRLRIGTIIDPEFTRLGALLRGLLESGAQLETELRHGVSGEIPEALIRDELDAGFYLGDLRQMDPARPGEAQDSAFQALRLTPLTYRVIAPPQMAGLLSGKGWAEVAALPWIGTPPQSVHNRLLTPLFQGLGVRQNVVARVDQEASMLAMVRSGLGLSLCREAVALQERHNHGLGVAEDLRLQTSLNFVMLQSRQTEPALALARETLERIWSAGA
ncbi:LysR family transcriptional regulator [Phaeovulum sp. W22_SRMD_FR3]|uniref:LysR family transcriptional regulator n=1 Tax=Phaeovulum sp. W22_SRMD_FR3 TaxID=3240274 RepID=UPI003F99F185